MDKFWFILPFIFNFYLSDVLLQEIQFPPTIVNHPARLKVYAGREDLNINCGAKGPNGDLVGPSGKLDYEWYHRKSEQDPWVKINIIGEAGWAWTSENDNGNIRIKQEIVSDDRAKYSGEYQCIVSLDNHYKVKSSIGLLVYYAIPLTSNTPVHLDINRHTHFIIEPKYIKLDCNLIECQNFRIRPKIEGKPDPGVFRSSRMVYDRETGHFIVMRADSEDHNRRFHILFDFIESSVGETNDPRDIRITGDQSNINNDIIYHTTTNNNNQNEFHRFSKEDISFTCAVKGNPLPTLTWSKENGNIPSKADRSERYRLKIGDLQPGDSGVYKCSIGSGIEKTFSLKVEDFFDFEDKPENQNASVGDTNIQWKCRGTPGQHNYEFNVNGEKPVSDFYVANNIMKLEKVERTHEGVIQCNINKPSTRESKSSSAYFLVFDKTTITAKNEAEINVTQDMDEVKLECKVSVDGRLPFSLEWYKDGKKLEIDGNTFKIEGADNKEKNLIIDAKSKSIFGRYRCKGDNGYSEDFSDEILLYQGVPTPAPVVQKSAFPWWIFAIIAGALIFFIVVLCICLYIQRNKGEEYKVDLLERKQGLDPEAELRAEDFKEYQRPDDSKPLYDEPFKIHTSEESLEEYGEEIREDGSFIGAYKPPRNNYNRDTDV
ncbi:DgyrCDS10033 [Dimorphilus gyrociliatus]|uniref:DgyrCDS10033 n=1 Tax=Dimorphilus gyrociliatus TaxID=2664684 RepID=A0A7I8W439_9ANNE|nr:DgyrCDS10033 [Dimorphilus gyrociliatus]